MPKLTVILDDDLLRRFKAVSAREGKTVSEIIRGFMAAYVAAKEKEQAGAP